MDKQVALFEAFIDASKRMKRLHEEEQKSREEYQSRGLPMPSARKNELQVLQEKELNALFDITQEGEILKEIKDIMDELQIITHINECQGVVLSKFNQLLLEQNKALKKGKGSKSKSIATLNQQEEEFQASPADLAEATELIVRSKARRVIVSNLYRKADRAYVAIRDLLELKQKQANISEARSARQSAEEGAKQAEETTKQGFSIMLFTIVTILFLPLSSLASLFALDVPGLSNGNLPLGTVFAILFPVSAVVVSISFTLAFHDGTRRLVLIFLRVCYRHFPPVPILTPESLDKLQEKHINASGKGGDGSSTEQSGSKDSNVGKPGDENV